MAEAIRGNPIQDREARRPETEASNKAALPWRWRIRRSCEGNLQDRISGLLLEDER